MAPIDAVGDFFFEFIGMTTVGAPQHRLLRVGSVGAGYFAQFHLEAWSRLASEGSVTHAGLVDVNQERADLAKRRFGIVASFPDIEAMLDTIELDILDIATPPDTHSALIESASRRGIACICQKPVAADLKQSVAIVEMAERANIPLIVHENFRWMPWFKEMKRCIEQGLFGQLHSISVRLRPGDGQGPGAYLDRQPYFQKMPRFLVHETLIHLIDAFRFLMGEITQVSAQLRRINPVIAGEDAGYIIFKFANGATAMIDANRSNDHVADNTRLTMGEHWLEGSQGVMRLNGDGQMFWKPHRAPEQEHFYRWDNRGFAGDCVYEQQRHIVQSLMSGAKPVNTGREYLRNIEIEEAIYRSSADNRAIDV